MQPVLMSMMCKLYVVLVWEVAIGWLSMHIEGYRLGPYISRHVGSKLVTSFL